MNGREGKDAAGIAYGSDMIFDHMSVTWGRDECFSINGDPKKPADQPRNITIQNSFIGQGLQSSFLWWTYPDHDKRWSYFVPESVYRQ